MCTAVGRGLETDLPPENELSRGVVGDESVATVGIVELEWRSPATKVLLQLCHPGRDGSEALLAERRQLRPTGGAAGEGHNDRRSRRWGRAREVAAGGVVDTLRPGRARF